MKIVPSSISSSNDRLPRGAWGRSWCVSTLLVLICLGAFELTFRRMGFWPEVQDSQWHWMLERARVRPLDSRQWVLLGSSRMQCDIDLEVLNRLTGVRPVQLAVPGSSCLPVLEDLARDQTFGGVVVCELLPGLVSNTGWISDRDRQERYVQAYDSRSADALFEATLRSEIQQRFLFPQPRLSVWSLGKHVLSGTCPKPSSHVVLPDRSARIFSGGQPLVTRNPMSGVGNLIDSTAVAATTARLRECANVIRRRGGAVVFARFPSSGALRIDECSAFRRSEEWDPFAQTVETPCLHFADDPELKDFICPDESHLDATDVERFTGILYDRVTKAIAQNKKR